MSEDILQISNWERWQTYRGDRGTPPWIKVYRNLFSNPEWATLSDAEKGQLVSIWILASDKKGTITNNPKTVQKMCQLDDKPNINKFIELGFIVLPCQPSGNQVVTTCPQLDAPETETETETDCAPIECAVGQEQKNARPHVIIPFLKIVSYLNERAGSSFTEKAAATKLHIKARFAEGFVLQDFFDVIDHKVSEWGTDAKMVQYLRPITLFGTKFESYLHNARAEPVKNLPPGHDWIVPDLDELRRKKDLEYAQKTATDTDQNDSAGDNWEQHEAIN